MNTLQRAGKNIFWLTISEGLARGTIFLASLYLARVLGASGFGLFSLAVLVGFNLWCIADMGVSAYGIKEVAQNRGKAEELLVTLNSMRIFAAASIFIIFVIVLFSLDLTYEKRIVLLCGGNIHFG